MCCFDCKAECCRGICWPLVRPRTCTTCGCEADLDCCSCCRGCSMCNVCGSCDPPKVVYQQPVVQQGMPMVVAPQGQQMNPMYVIQQPQGQQVNPMYVIQQPPHQ